MELKITKLNLYRLNQALESITPTNKDLTYTLIKNKKALETEVSAIEEARNFSNPDFLKYQEELNKVAQEYGEKDSSGRVVTTGTGFRVVDSEKAEEVQELVKKLQDKYKDGIDKQNEDTIKFEEMLTEEITVEVTPIKFSDLPDDISKEVMELIIDIIEE